MLQDEGELAPGMKGGEEEWIGYQVEAPDG